MNKHKVCVWAGVLAMVSGVARAQVAPQGAVHATSGPGAGLAASPSPTGGYPASVALDLPGSRSGLPVPLSVVYTGAADAGAAGAGWEVPIAYVRRSHSTWRRKPAFAFTGAERAVERMYVSLGGNRQLMVPKGSAYVPFMASEYSELRTDGAGWRLRTLDNREYVFAPSASVGKTAWTGDPDLWVLTEIRDVATTDRVTIEYTTESECAGNRELNLDRIKYGYDPAGEEPLYEISLAYAPWGGSSSCHGFGAVHDDGLHFKRTRLLEAITVEARNNLAPQESARAIRSYDLSYDTDRDLGTPRLVSVTRHGEEGSSVEALPVASYAYGALSRAPSTPGGERVVEFGGWTEIARPAAFAMLTSFEEDIATSEVERLDLYWEIPDQSYPPNSPLLDRIHAKRETTRARHLMRDLTGDGVTDLVFKVGETWYLSPGQASEGVTSFGEPGSWHGSLGPAELHEQTTFRFTEATLNEHCPLANRTELCERLRRAMITEETWSQFIDWNGDGRLDVVDVRGGQTPDQWRVWINRPGGSPGQPIYWMPVQVPVQNMRQHLASRGLQRDDYSDLFPDEDWEPRLPVERTRSWPRVETADCTMYACPSGWASCEEISDVCPPIQEDNPSLPPPPSQPRDYERSLGTDTVIEWQLADRNSDGFPDFVALRQPVRLAFDDDRSGYGPGCSGGSDWQPQDAYTCTDRHREWLTTDLDIECPPLETCDNDPGADYFLNFSGPFSTFTPGPFSSTPVDIGAVGRWTTGVRDDSGQMWQVPQQIDQGFSWQSGGLEDRYGTGTLRLSTGDQYDRMRTAFQSDRHLVCGQADPGSDPTISKQVSGAVDLNGDGLLDQIYRHNTEGWKVAFNTGAHMGPPRRLTWYSTTGDDFPLSESVSRCDDDVHTRGGITDMDGDGKPELIRADGQGKLYMARLSIYEADNVHSIGRLQAISNGYGATTRIRYANAKATYATEHAVPFPEIVVRDVRTEVDDGSSPGLAPVHFAYQTARLEYDPLAGRWVFPGYQRRSVLVGGSPEPSFVDGVLTTYVAAPAAAPGASFEGHATAHQPATSYAREGRFDLEQFRANAYDDPTLAFQQGTTEYGVRILTESPIEPIDAFDCDDLVPDTGMMSSWWGGSLGGRCHTAGIVYAARAEGWEGQSGPPGTNNVLAASSVTEVDAFGRPTRLHNHGDLRRTDDDICTTVTYATPSDGGAFPSVPSGVATTDCGLGIDSAGTPKILSSSRMFYDDLPAGQVGVGRLTSRVVDRYDASGFLDSFEVERLTYDAAGQVVELIAPRALGTAAERRRTLVRDEFGASIVEVHDHASDVGLTLTSTSQRSTWPSVVASSIDANGLTSHAESDGHGRPLRTWVETADGKSTTLGTVAYDPQGTWVRSTTYPAGADPGGEAGAEVPQVSTTYLDALRRPRFTQRELGEDYGQSTLISGLVEYDALGRVAFAAAPFESAELPFVPESLAAPVYGVSQAWDLRGRVVRVVEANGLDQTSLYSSPADDRFVTSFQYAYTAGQAVTWHRGPDENDVSSSRYAHSDASWRTALGYEVERTRVHADASHLDLVRQQYDRLGRITRTSRYADPANAQVPIEWNYHLDSLGRMVSITEPGTATRFNEYDEQGNLLESWWEEGVVRNITRQTYDGFGRLTQRELIKRVSGNESIESVDRNHYDAHSGDPAQPPADFRGRLSWSETDGVGAIFLGYDSFGRAASTTYRYDGQPQLVTQRAEYNLGGQLEAIRLLTDVTNDDIAYTYDSAGRVQSVSDGASEVYWYARAVAFDGHVDAVDLGNGLRETFERAPDGRREPFSWSVNTQPGEYSFSNLSRDAAGRVTSERIKRAGNTELRSYEHDSLGRLTGAAHIGGGWPGAEVYAHDPLGNLTSREANTGVGDRTYERDPTDLDRLCRYAAPGTSGPCTFSYDGAGSVIFDASGGPGLERDFKYDPAGRMINIQRGGHQAELTYGPAGRARTLVDGLTDRTHWSFGGLVEIHERAGHSHVARHIPGPHGIVATLRTSAQGDSIVYRHGDGRANHVFTDGSGDVVQAPTYTTFGQASDPIGNTDPMETTDDLWNGGDAIPELGVVLLGHRAYDPDLGRFLQRDPIAITARASTANPYAFAFSDPINFSDPTGLSPRETSQGPSSSSSNSPGWSLAAAASKLALDVLRADRGGGSPAAVAVGADSVDLSWRDSARTRATARLRNFAVDTYGSAVAGFNVEGLTAHMDPTNPMEYARVLSHASTVAYNNGHRASTLPGWAQKELTAATAFADGASMGVGPFTRAQTGIGDSLDMNSGAYRWGSAVWFGAQSGMTAGFAAPVVPTIRPAPVPNGGAIVKAGGGGGGGGGGGMPGWSHVSRWVSPREAAVWRGRSTIPQPMPTSTPPARTYVTDLGAPRPGGTGPVRIDFRVPTASLEKTNHNGWWQIFNEGRCVPIRDLKIN